MAIEIEHKFLLNPGLLPENREGVLITQGYLVTEPGKSVRVRIAGHKAFLTIKGGDAAGRREEFEYEIPSDDAIHLLMNYCEGLPVSKIRHHIVYGKKLWEVDEFLEDNQGLWIAELEVDDAHEIFERPPWVTKEVTGDPHYYNTYLSAHPFSSWKET